MRTVRFLILYFAFVFIGGALLAPWVYHFAQVTASGGVVFREIAEQPFHRYVNRALIFLAIVGLWPFLRGLAVRTWKDFGFVTTRDQWKHALSGFSIGFCSLAIVAAAGISFGVREWDLTESPQTMVAKLFSATLSAIIVSVLEETLFRGAIFGALRKNHSWQLALLFSSVLYALFHFFAKPPTTTSVDWSSGFTTLAAMFRGFVDFEAMLPGFLNLLIVGLILGIGFQRTGNLLFSIGLHAGWIFWLKSYGIITTRGSNPDLWFWGSKKLIDGWLALFVLLVTFGFVIFSRKKAIDESH